LSLVSSEFLNFGGRIQEKKNKHLQIFFPLIATLFFFSLKTILKDPIMKENKMKKKIR